jgi:hypothetical protein
MRGNKGVDIDIREESGCEVGDGLRIARRAACSGGWGCVWGSTHAIGCETNEAREK